MIRLQGCRGGDAASDDRPGQTAFRRALRAVGIVGLLAVGAGLQPMVAAPEKLRPWTAALRAAQPEDAFAAVYRHGRQRLVFVAANHENQTDSPTFRTIRAAYAAFRFDTVIAEGWPTSWGINPARIVDEFGAASPDNAGFVAGGETVPTVVGARQRGAALFGGEADDATVRAQVTAAGITPDDLLGFYVLRTIPQWIGERQIDSAADPRLTALVAAALAHDRARLDLPSTVLPDYVSWAAWYRAINRQPIGAAFVAAEVGPLADGRFGTNRIAYAVSRARDSYLHGLVIDHLNRGENVFVVFGGSHLMIQRPALDAVLGRPCYVGANLSRAPVACR